MSDMISVKRLQNEIKLLFRDPIKEIDAYPDENNMFLWYFLAKGQDDSDYKGGCYIGKIMLSDGYPKTPVDFMMLTPNGRFSINRKICLSNSGYHSDQWTPMWNMRTILMAFLSIMLDDDTTGLSHIKESKHERRIKAENSFSYNISNYKDIMINFKRFVDYDKENDTIRLRTDEEIELLDKKAKKNKSKRKKIKKKD